MAGLVVVIGPYPAYLRLATAIGGRAFAIPPSTWAAMSEGERWRTNRAFLDQAIADGAVFRLAQAPAQAKVGSFFALEVEYLISLGFVSRWRDGYWELVR